MKILILSDLHNEFTEFQPVETAADVVVLAGDIDHGADGIRWARRAWPGHPIVYVAGNHEYYRGDLVATLALMRQTAQSLGIHLLEENAAVLDGVRFLGATLWTDFEYFGAEHKVAAMEEGQRCLNDFRLIRNGEHGTFTPAQSIALHRQARAWLESRLAEPFDGPTVVVTHHLPSIRSVAARFLDTPLSACFVSHLDPLFGSMALWIHGHSHDNADYVAHGTHVVCNPRGYVTQRGIENPAFDPGKIVEI